MNKFMPMSSRHVQARKCWKNSRHKKNTVDAHDGNDGSAITLFRAETRKGPEYSMHGFPMQPPDLASLLTPIEAENVGRV